MRRILGIDPGPKKSGVALLETSATERDPVGGGHNSKQVTCGVLGNLTLVASFCTSIPYAIANELPIDETMGEIEACTCLSNEQRREVERLREKENARHNHLPMG